MRRLPQFDVSAALFARSVPAGLIASIVAWVIVSFVPYLRFFLAILVGAAVGEVMSRLAKRRVNHWLEAAAVLDVIAGLVAATAVLSGIGVGHLARALVLEPSLLLSFLLPAAVASLVAIVKMR